MARTFFILPVVLAALLAGCSEKPQTAGTQVSGPKNWSGAQPAFSAPGFKAGDQAAWEEQIRQRNLRQNEYVRMTP